MAAKHRATALTGRPVGGTRPFGWNWTDGKAPITLQDGRVIPAGHRQHVINEDEKKVIQQAATDVLLGVSLITICRDLNERGVRTTRGNEWRPGPLRLMLESPRLAGYRVHRGTFLPNKDGTGFVLGEWDPVLDEDSWQQLYDKLRSRSGQPARSEANRSYLLSGLLRCSECLGPMSGNARKDIGHFYACKVRNGTGGKAGCGKVTCSGPAVDELVRRMIKQRMVLSAVEVGDDPWPLERELWAAKQKMADMVPELTEAQGDARRLLNAAFTKLSDEVEQMRADRASWLLERGKHVRRAAVGPEQFDAMTVEKQRAYVRGELTAIFVRPATRRGNRFDYTRLSTVWRETTEPEA